MKLRTRTAPVLPGVVGTARVDRRSSSAVRRARPGDVVVLDHVDLDRALAEALVEAGVAAVVNAASTTAATPASTSASARARSRSTWSRTAMSPGPTRRSAARDRRSTRAVPTTPGRTGEVRVRSLMTDSS